MQVTFQDIANKKAELDAVMQEYGEAALKTLLQDFFNAHPYVTHLTWTQYTPYFNDGEPCEFHTHEIYVGLTDVGAEEYVQQKRRSNQRYDDYGIGDPDMVVVSSYGLLDSDFRNDFKALCATIASNQETMKIALGDHVEVTARPDEITVKEYAHD